MFDSTETSPPDIRRSSVNRFRTNTLDRTTLAQSIAIAAGILATISILVGWPGISLGAWFAWTVGAVGACAWVRERQRSLAAEDSSGDPRGNSYSGEARLPADLPSDRSTESSAGVTQLQPTLMQLPDAACWLDRAGRVTGYNWRFVEAFELSGVDPDGGLGLASLGMPFEVSEVMETLHDEITKEGESSSPAQTAWTAKDGIRYRVQISAHPLASVSGESAGTLLCFKTSPADILNVSHAESIASTIMNSPGEIYFVDAQTLRITEANRGAGESLGYSYAELTTMTLLDIQCFEDRAAFESKIEPLLFGETHELMYEIRQRRQDETDYAALIHLHHGTVCDRPGYVVFATDLTTWNHLQSRVLLAHQIRSITQFAGGVSHEINSPLQCLLGNLEFITSGLAELSSFRLGGEPRELSRADSSALAAIKRANFMKAVELASERLVESTPPRDSGEGDFCFMMDQLPAVLDEMRSASSRIAEVISAMNVSTRLVNHGTHHVDVNDLIVKASAYFESDLGCDCALRLDLCSEATTVRANAAELTQVVRNLVTNAQEAILRRRDRGSDPPGQVTIRTRSEPQTLRIEVSDNGDGMTDEVRRHAFDPLYTTKDVGEGLGHGLATCFDVIVQRLGGTIEFGPSETGTCVVIEIDRMSTFANDSAVGIGYAPGATGTSEQLSTTSRKDTDHIASSTRYGQSTTAKRARIPDACAHAPAAENYPQPTSEPISFQDLQSYASRVLQEAEAGENHE